MSAKMNGDGAAAELAKATLFPASTTSPSSSPAAPAYDFSAMQALIDAGCITNRSSFPPLLNSALLLAARRQPVPHVPVWAHRQAGRYLPEFRRARGSTDFFVTCRTPLHAAELTVQPIDRGFGLDAAIVFSDILVIPQLLGLEVQMVAGKGPVVLQPLATAADVARLLPEAEVDVARDLQYVMQALTLSRHALRGRVPLIGFSGAPFTLFGYMVEGGGSRTWDAARRFMYCHPEATHEVMRRLTAVIVEYLLLQVEAGAQMLEVFDTNVGCLTPELWDTFVQPYLHVRTAALAAFTLPGSLPHRRSLPLSFLLCAFSCCLVQSIAADVKAQLRKRQLPVVPMTVFPKGAHWALHSLSFSEYDVVSIDWSTPPAWARQQVGDRVALQGNLDPAALFAPEPELRRLVRQMLDGFGCVGTIANLGHGMLPEHQPQQLAAFVDEVHSYSQTLAAKHSAEAK